MINSSRKANYLIYNEITHICLFEPAILMSDLLILFGAGMNHEGAYNRRHAVLISPIKEHLKVVIFEKTF